MSPSRDWDALSSHPHITMDIIKKYKFNEWN